MPSFDRHINQAKSNIEMARLLLDDGNHPDWVITGCFYAAVHFTEAIINRESPITCLFSNGSECKSDNADHTEEFRHEDKRITNTWRSTHWYRERIIEHNPDYFGDCYEDAYRSLSELAHTSRYGCYDGCADDVPVMREKIAEILSHMADRYHVETSL